MPHAAQLDQLMLEHHEMYVRLYGDCLKPKLHYMRHVPACIAFHRCQFSCFATERKHKFSKRIAGFTYRNIGKNLLLKSLRAFLLEVENPHAFDKIQLGPKSKQMSNLNSRLQEVGGEDAVMQQYADIVTAMGTFQKGDVLVWGDNGSLSLGTALHFVLVLTAAMPSMRDAINTNLFACVRDLVCVDGRHWRHPLGAPHTFIRATCIRMAVAYQKEGDAKLVVLPSVM